MGLNARDKILAAARKMIIAGKMSAFAATNKARARFAAGGCAQWARHYRTGWGGGRPPDDGRRMLEHGSALGATELLFLRRYF